MDHWLSFFQGELSGAASLTGLIFVGLSVNLAKILELASILNRAVEALLLSFLLFVMAEVMLIPDQPLRLVGSELVALSVLTMWIMIKAQHRYYEHIPGHRRRKATYLIWLGRIATALVGVSGALLAVTNDLCALYLLPPAVLLTFTTVVSNAWVLIIDING